MKLFQVIREGSLWGVYAVSASYPNDRRLVSNSLTADEQFAIDLADVLNRIAATHADESDLVELGSELGVYDPPHRIVRFDD
jgi:hypothetical protein